MRNRRDQRDVACHRDPVDWPSLPRHANEPTIQYTHRVRAEEGVAVTLDLSYNREQVALQRSIAGHCERSGLGPLAASSVGLPVGFWAGLAELGVLGLGTVEGGGGPVDIAAGMETLGFFAAPGPLVSTFHAGALLDHAAMSAVARGTNFVSVGAGSTFPWAPIASQFVEIDGQEAWLVSIDPFEEVSTTAREPWGVGSPRRLQPLGDASRANAIAEVAIAAYLIGAGHRLIDQAAEYARDRHQFGKPIATFQAVSHPLAQLSTRLGASRVLCRGAAQRLEDRTYDAHRSAAVARVSAVGSASDTGYAVHQIYGAMGFTREGPVATFSHRIRQVGCLPPGVRTSRSRVLDGVANL